MHAKVFWWVSGVTYTARRDENGYWQWALYYDVFDTLLDEGFVEISRETAQRMGWPS